MKIDGACHCGYITYVAEIDPDKAGICHCTDCQTLSGSAFRMSVPAPKEAFTHKMKDEGVEDPVGWTLEQLELAQCPS